MSVSPVGRSIGLQLAMFAAAGQLSWSHSACDLNQDGAVNIVDVQLAANMALGLIPCTAIPNVLGTCSVVTVQRVTNATLGLACVTEAGAGPHSVTLSWTASVSPNVIGYNVYRSGAGSGPYTKVNSALIAGTTYLDTAVQAGQTYYYVATALDSDRNESGYSNQAQAVVPLP